MSTEEAGRDDCCDFGRWLHGRDVPVSARNDHFAKVRELHARFHRHAGQVLTMLDAGKAGEADTLIEGEFTTTSAALSAEMMRWQNSLR